ncbi:MAG TPA: ATP synthase F1 subunit delta [Cytophagales bacterium]|nr:ATP synthase F1 subunit delta [Cytophagales bacterium]
MSEIRVSLRYAQSLLDLAQEKGLLEEVNKDMQLFEKVGRENRAFLLMLKNPIITHEKKLAVLKGIFKGRVNDLTIAIFDIIVRKHREPILLSVAKEFHNLYNERKGVEKATITTVAPLTEELRTKFISLIKNTFGKEVELHEAVNKDLLGGYVLKVGDRQIDESLRSKLESIRREFSHNPYVKAY